MNLKKSYYLSERIYETMNCEEKQSEARKKYWRNRACEKNSVN